MPAEPPQNSEPSDGSPADASVDEPSPPSGKLRVRRRYEKPGFWVATVGTIAGIVGAIAAVVPLTQKPVSPPPIPDQPPTASSSCVPVGQPGAHMAKVVSLVEPSYPVSAGVASYKISVADKLELEVGGELHGAIPSGKKLFLLSRGDPTTMDSTPDHNRGNGTYYLLSTMQVVGNCWWRPEKEIAYPGAEGITLQQTLVLVDDTLVREFISDRHKYGYNDAVLDSLRVKRLAYFDVPTRQ
jgi:hypothetical protein